MTVQTPDRMLRSTKRHLLMEAGDTLRKIRDFGENPSAMGYFYDLFHSVYCEGKRPAHGKRVIGTTCVQVPEEIIHAAGAVAVRLCGGAHAHDQLGAEYTSSKTCSLVNATLGGLRADIDALRKEMDMLVVPATCDQKKQAAKIMKGWGLNVYTLDVPSVKDSEEARNYWRENVKRFAHDIQKLPGVKITKERIARSIGMLNRARAEFRKLNSHRAASPSPILGTDVMLVSNAYFLDDVESWTLAVAALNAELEKRRGEGFSATNRRAPRILLTGTPPIFPNLKLPILIEEVGGIVVADEVCSSTRLLHDAVAFDEKNYFDLIPAIADRYLKPCTCPIFDSCEDRVRKLTCMARDLGVRGVVYQSLSGCQLYTMESHMIADAMAKEGIPMLYVETDYGPEDAGQLLTRIEAFLESIHIQGRRTDR